MPTYRIANVDIELVKVDPKVYGVLAFDLQLVCHSNSDKSCHAHQQCPRPQWSYAKQLLTRCQGELIDGFLTLAGREPGWSFALRFW